MKETLTPKIRIKRDESPYSFNRLLKVPAGKDRCHVVYHLLVSGVTIERGGIPARYDEQAGLFQMISHSNLDYILVKPTIKRTINPLIYDIMINMNNLSKEISLLCEIGARYEAFIDNIGGTRESKIILNNKESEPISNDSFDKQLGLDVNDFDIG